MNACDIILRLHQHRQWVNSNIMAAVSSLSRDQLHCSFGIGQGSVWKSLLHLIAAEYVWLEALQGNDSPVFPGDLPEKLPGNQQGTGGIESLDELAARWKELDQRWDRYLLSLREDDLEDRVCKMSTSSGQLKRHATRRADVLLHVCTHAQYTVAQVMNMLRQLGVETLPDVMLITLARQEAARP